MLIFGELRERSCADRAGLLIIPLDKNSSLQDFVLPRRQVETVNKDVSRFSWVPSCARAAEAGALLVKCESVLILLVTWCGRAQRWCSNGRLMESATRKQRSWTGRRDAGSVSTYGTSATISGTITGNCHLPVKPDLSCHPCNAGFHLQSQRATPSGLFLPVIWKQKFDTLLPLQASIALARALGEALPRNTSTAASVRNEITFNIQYKLLI